jgi:hypothetical protein
MKGAQGLVPIQRGDGNAAGVAQETSGVINAQPFPRAAESRLTMALRSLLPKSAERSNRSARNARTMDQLRLKSALPWTHGMAQTLASFLQAFSGFATCHSVPVAGYRPNRTSRHHSPKLLRLPKTARKPEEMAR